jgi:hypothetical protein
MVSRWALVAVGAVLALAAGCGAPQFTYVTNSNDKTYVKLPVSWQQIDRKAMDDAIGLDPATTDEERGLWFEAYDADSAPSPQHVFGSDSPQPAVFVGVQQVPETAREQYASGGLDGLRDLFYPVSDTARLGEVASGSAGLTDFTLIKDEELNPKGLHGVHSVFSYRMGGSPLQTIDQTAYLNEDASKLYMFFVRCSAQCYEQRQQEIGTVVSSFTVRES